jgi:peptidyl-prolyl cis-trans isomerase A (cyclophilin A)
MRTAGLLVASLIMLATLAPAARAQSAAGAAGPTIIIETSAGEIRVSLDTAHAPATTANFLRYVDQHFYDDTAFYRTVRADNQPDNAVKIDVIPGGLHDEAGAGYAPIPLEPTSKTGLRHVDGAISMARDGPDTATSEFFICIGDQPELDFGGRRNPDGQGFAAFGRVTAGMEVVRRIQQSPAREQRLDPPITILRIRRAA